MLETPQEFYERALAGADVEGELAAETLQVAVDTLVELGGLAGG